jgi:hypothetical protein
LLLQATAIDRLDGGFTLVIRQPGAFSSSQSGKVTANSNPVLDVYLPSREIQLYGNELDEAIGQIMHIFGNKIAVPHLQHLDERFKKSGRLQRINPISSTCQVESRPTAAIKGSTYFHLSYNNVNTSEADDTTDYGDDSFWASDEAIRVLEEVEKTADYQVCISAKL